MKNLWIIVLVFLIVGVLGLYWFSFQVRETETVVVTRFGEPVRTISEPDWYMKWPVPINKVHRFDSRNHFFELDLEQTNTRNGEPILVTSYVVWRISDPQKFLESVENEREAETQLESLVRDAQNKVVGQYSFSEFVNSDPEKIKFNEIEQEMLARLDQAETDYGIDITKAGIKRLGVPESVTQKVFDRIRADRERRIAKIIADGEAAAGKIRADAESKRTELLAIVEAEAKAIKGRGDAEAAKYYKMLEEDPQLAMFLRDLEALKKILKQKSTIVLGADSDPLKLLKGLPELDLPEAEEQSEDAVAADGQSS
ncbi:Modulator of FtsH protease HflC [Anaerohalosphaera lusitana]|uniref:Protein HflC n=1 Tax=Anaerohalosphaera lusitana TaxID=1936003 RepID=A0A1U9NLP2_9BACT|nr:protease modulator HflC [Anaerohalosphaera lusitana]AQT68853.1 Modulator of FtsH protease HflC [Anaerohalosphaera lusitana]